MIKVSKFISVFVLRYFLKEIENMFCVSIKLEKHVKVWEMLCEHEPQASVPQLFRVLPNFVFKNS